MKAATSQPVVRSLSGLSAPERSSAVEAAVQAWGEGRLVVMPTDTLYGIAAAANSRPGLDRLAGLTAATRTSPGAATWHAPSAEAAWDVIQPESPVHRRLMRRFLPGPVTFVVQRNEAELVKVRARLGGAPGSLFVGSAMAVRVPDNPVAHELLAAAAKANLTIVADGLGAAGYGRGATVTDELRAAVEAGPTDTQPIALVLDDGPTKWGKPSTTIRLRSDGGYEVLYEGALPERIIRKQLERTILFVCTGNTCRSPMAEAIAKHLLASRPRESGMTLRVRSAGATAAPGVPVSSEAVRALGRMGVDVGELSRHHSRELTRQEIADADVIYVMTSGHARAVLSIDPTADDKVRVLDPEGGDVPDPIGSPQDVYTRTAERIKELIERRLKEEE